MSLPYFPMYPTDFEADTAHLNLEEDGAYNRLLRLMWMTPGCSIPDDPAWIARRMRVDMVTFLRLIEPIIGEFCQRKNGRVLSPRLQREWKKADETSRKRSEAGKRGGRQKAIEFAKEDAKPGISRDEAGPKHPEPYPEPEPLEKEEAIASSKKPPRRRPETELPEGWVPSDRNLSDAFARNFTQSEADHEAQQFRDHHLARGSRFRDWDAAWRTWLGNARKFGARSGVAVGPFPGAGRQGTSMASIVALRRLNGDV